MNHSLEIFTRKKNEINHGVNKYTLEKRVENAIHNLTNIISHYPKRFHVNYKEQYFIPVVNYSNGAFRITFFSESIK